MKKGPLWLLPVLLSLLAPTFVQAEPGALDRGFGGGGKVTSVVAGDWRGGFGSTYLAWGGRGKIVVANRQTLLEYLPNGSRNRRFGGDGRVRIEPPEGTTSLTGLAADSLGRVLVAGTTATEGTAASALVMRYLPDGRLDPAFGDGGVVVTNFGLPAPTAPPPMEGGPPVPPGADLPNVDVRGLAVDAADRPVLTGSWVSARRWCYLLSYEAQGTGYTARLGTDGSADSSFDGDGVATDPAGEIEFRPVIDGSGVLAVGANPYCRRGLSPPPTLTRVSEDGAPDEAFGAGGRVELPYSDIPEVARDRFGRILLLDLAPGTDALWKLLRLTPRGSTDRRFAGGKGALLSLGVGAALGVDGRGRPLIATPVGNPRKEWKFMLMRRRSDGSLDRRFGHRGRVRTGFSGSALPSQVLIDGEGRILVGGSMDRGKRQGIALARYLSR